MPSRNKRLDWSATAARELIDGLVHIAEDSPQGARLVKGRIDRAGRFLEQNPRMGKPGVVAGTREYPVPKTSYTLSTFDIDLVLAMKRAANRSKDRMDIEALEKIKRGEDPNV